MSTLKLTAGSTYRDTLHWATEECLFVTASVVPGAPLRLFAPGHTLPHGWPIVYIEGHPSISPQQVHTVAVIDADTLEIPCLNGAHYRAAGVVIRALKPVELAGYSARMQIRDKSGAVLLELDSATLTGARIIIDDTNKTILREIPADVTASLTWSSGVFDLEMSQGDYVVKIDSGPVVVQSEVTK